MIEGIEEAMVARLSAVWQGSGFEVAAFPESGAHTLRTRAAVLVSFAGEVFDRSPSGEVVDQEGALQFEVLVKVQKLQPLVIGYAILELNRKKLRALRVPGCAKMYPVSEKPLDEDAGARYYQQIFAVRRTVTQAMD